MERAHLAVLRAGRAIWIVALLGSVLAARAQVHSLTLGIDVNSPYGLGEPWVMIREGLQRLEFVEAISPLPDREALTGEMRPRHGRMPDLDLLAKALRDTGAGASLRGVEATVEGQLLKDGDAFLLRVPGSQAPICLKPLKAVVQRHRQPTSSEKAAHESLVSQWKNRPLRVQVVGPLLKPSDAPSGTPNPILWLEVRTFAFKP